MREFALSEPLSSALGPGPERPCGLCRLYGDGLLPGLSLFGGLTPCLPQPWRCLCLGFSQMTMTLPLRLMILHFSHMGFTEGLTFICCTSYLLLQVMRPRVTS